jgi:hypothetical protein
MLTFRPARSSSKSVRGEMQTMMKSSVWEHKDNSKMMGD